MKTTNTETITGTYGNNQTPCNVITLQDGVNTWYCVEGSQNVNLAPELLSNGVDVETIQDIDCFTWNEPIENETELEESVNA